MPGRDQHHIPRQFLRGFATKERAKAMQLYVARAGVPVYKTSVDKIGAELDFYSGPASSGAATLDDEIRDYESRLLQLLAELRSHTIGDSLNPEIVSEVIAHLVPRSSSIRGIAEVGMTKLLEGARQLASPENVLTFLELDRPTPNELVSKQIAESLRAQKQLKHSPIPMEVLERMLYTYMQENRTDFANNGFPEIAQFLEIFRSEVPNVLRQTHQNVLKENLVQPVRKRQLSEFHWTLAEAPEHGALLSDCIAVTYCNDEKDPGPLMGADMVQVTSVIMPLCAELLLIGTRSPDVSVEVERYNLDAASCSSVFFVSKRRLDNLDQLADNIGQITQRSMSSIVNSFLGRTLSVMAIDASKDVPARPWVGNFSYNLQLPGTMTEHQIAQVTQTIKKAMSILAQNGGVRIINGISFPADVYERIKCIEGFTEQQPVSLSAVSTYIHRYEVDEQSQLEIFMAEEFAWGLVDEDDEKTNYASQWLLAEIGEAEFYGLLDQSFPNILQKRLTGNHSDSLLGVITGAWLPTFG